MSSSSEILPRSQRSGQSRENLAADTATMKVWPTHQAAGAIVTEDKNLSTDA